MDNIEHMTLIFLDYPSHISIIKKTPRYHLKKSHPRGDHHEWIGGYLSGSPSLILFFCLCHRKNNIHICVLPVEITYMWPNR